jgi:hypothetical protein
VKVVLFTGLLRSRCISDRSFLNFTRVVTGEDDSMGSSPQDPDTEAVGRVARLHCRHDHLTYERLDFGVAGSLPYRNVNSRSIQIITGNIGDRLDDFVMSRSDGTSNCRAVPRLGRIRTSSEHREGYQ